MAIKVGEKDLFPYLGDYGPVSIYKGEQKIAGYRWAEKSGQELHFDNAYNSLVRVEVDGQSYQHAEPTPDYHIEIESVGGFDVVSSVEKLSEGQLQEYDYDVEHENVDKINLSLSEPLRSVGDVKDRIFKDSDGLWKVERNVGEVVVDGIEKKGSWSDAFRLFAIPAPNVRPNRATPVSNYITNKWESIPYIVNSNNSGTLWVVSDENWLTNSTDFNEWAKKKNNLGQPLVAQYELNNSTTETLDQELQDQLNTLKSFKGSNYIYTVQNTDNPHKEQLKPTLHAKTKVKDI